MAKRKSSTSSGNLGEEEGKLATAHWNLIKDEAWLRTEIGNNELHLSEWQRKIKELQRSLARATEEYQTSESQLENVKQDLQRVLAEQEVIRGQSDQVNAGSRCNRSPYAKKRYLRQTSPTTERTDSRDETRGENGVDNDESVGG
ncbi:hypothetical protein AC579_7153 [Pseudocercospora musae]|uniref:Uncharacterized protein n=1 Tax=Pseudocercospora musae TaxID=113226 RepID=A0A139GTK9_9PEZI|nr:hypothetical protein AC579_7153 [Pseudocercospora musae]